MAFAIPHFLGCLGRADEQVVVYTALDREFSEPILEEFESETGITVRAKYDVESTKTVGLVTAIIQEQERPRCDLFWNNEILHTLRLEKMGLLTSYQSPRASDFPANYVSPEGHWYGFASRARVLIVNTDLIEDASAQPDSVMDLIDDRWKGKTAMAKPLFGTTATHAAVLWSRLGEAEAKQFFEKAKANVAILSGNKQVAQAVAAGEYVFGITDTDDAIIEVERGAPVTLIFPDQGSDQPGTLFIPNSLCLIHGSKNTENAKKLVDYLLRSETENKLAAGASAQIPVNLNANTTSRVMPKEEVKWMEVDFHEAAEAWPEASSFLQDTFQTSD